MSVRKFKEGIKLVPVDGFPANAEEGQLATSSGANVAKGLYQFIDGLWVPVSQTTNSVAGGVDKSIYYIPNTWSAIAELGTDIISSDSNGIYSTSSVKVTGNKTYTSNDAFITAQSIELAFDIDGRGTPGGSLEVSLSHYAFVAMNVIVELHTTSPSASQQVIGSYYSSSLHTGASKIIISSNNTTTSSSFKLVVSRIMAPYTATPDSNIQYLVDNVVVKVTPPNVYTN